MIQSILAVIGVGLVAYSLRCQIAFFMAPGTIVGSWRDWHFATGAMLVAQRFIFVV